MQITPLNVIAVADVTDHSRKCNTIGLNPLFGILPTTRYFSLCGKIHDPVRSLIIKEYRERIHVTIQVELLKPKVSSVLTFSIAKKRNRLFW